MVTKNKHEDFLPQLADIHPFGKDEPRFLEYTQLFVRSHGIYYYLSGRVAKTSSSVIM